MILYAFSYERPYSTTPIPSGLVTIGYGKMVFR
jgi:hypothetical protein